MQTIWIENFKIKSYEAEPSGKVRLESLFNYLQEAAGNHAADLSVGFDDLSKKHLFWVLSRIKIVVNELPIWGDEIVIHTWPKGIDKLFALRDFSIRNKYNKEIITATSAWLLVDEEKFRLHKIEDLGIALPDNDRKEAIHGTPEKITSSENPSKVFSQKIDFSDIDYVYHTNNTRYPSWIMNCYNPEYHKNNSIKSIQINYLEQSRFGETLELHLIETEKPGVHFFEGIKVDTSTKVFQAIVEWNT